MLKLLYLRMILKIQCIICASLWNSLQAESILCKDYSVKRNVINRAQSEQVIEYYNLRFVFDCI
jgi:hypothetical protein